MAGRKLYFKHLLVFSAATEEFESCQARDQT